MPGVASIGLLLILWAGQGDERPPYVREGDRLEQEFQSYQDRLRKFFTSLRRFVTQETPKLLPQFQDAQPPQRVVYGYQVLPRIVSDPPADNNPPLASFSYSWPTTAGYVAGESVQLGWAEDDLRRALLARDAAKPELITKLLRQYRELAANQRTIDQYIQYNRYWQRSIAQDRSRFDALTKLYDLMKVGELDTALAIRAVLDHPDVPSFLQVSEPEPNRIVISVPVYTDIEDEAFLASAKSAIEGMWQAADGDVTYALEVQFRNVHPSGLYGSEAAPKQGDRIEMRSHTGHFPSDGAVLTTGADATHGFVGRYVALGAGDLFPRTLAHEFGHVLGFRDGYIRGYRDLGEQGFEILELTSVFDDIMSAPRQGHVQAAHFKLILDALKRN